MYLKQLESLKQIWMQKLNLKWNKHRVEIHGVFSYTKIKRKGVSIWSIITMTTYTVAEKEN